MTTLIPAQVAPDSDPGDRLAPSRPAVLLDWLVRDLTPLAVAPFGLDRHAALLRNLPEITAGVAADPDLLRPHLAAGQAVAAVTEELLFRAMAGRGWAISDAGRPLTYRYLGDTVACLADTAVWQAWPSPCGWWAHHALDNAVGIIARVGPPRIRSDLLAAAAASHHGVTERLAAAVGDIISKGAVR